MTKKDLFYFIGKCLTLDEHPEFKFEILELIRIDAIDWLKFVELCSNHLVLTTIYLKFKKHGITSHLPDELAKHLKLVYELNQTRNSQILVQLRELTVTLNKENIYPVFLKGCGNLLDGLYASDGERMMNDIDLLVPEKDYLKAASLLQANGYSTSSETYDHVETLKHYLPLSHPEFITHVEIHRVPVSEQYNYWFNTQMVDHEKKSVPTLAGCFVLSDNHNIILNFIHSQLHHGGHINGIVSFRDLYDLHLLTKRVNLSFVLPEIKSRAKAVAYFRFMEKALGLDEKFTIKSNFSSWLFLKKHDLNLTSPAFYFVYRTVVFVTQRILRNLVVFIQIFYLKTVRKSMARRLRNRQWYIDHLKIYSNFISRK